MLHLIATAHGEDLVIEVSDQMLCNAVREGTASQRVSRQSRHGMRNAHLMRAIALTEAMIEEPLPPARIATEIGISTRRLERLFGRCLMSTPKACFMEMRLQRAQHAGADRTVGDGNRHGYGVSPGLVFFAGVSRAFRQIPPCTAQHAGMGREGGGASLTRPTVTRRARRLTSGRCRDFEILKRFRSDFF